MKDYLELFMIFSRIGAVTFGGGYSMLPILQKEIVEKKGWVTEEEVLDYYAISQCTPGIIAINTSIFIGYKCKKGLGGVFSALGMVFPSIVIILIVAMFIQNIMGIAVIQQAFAGIRIAVSALIINATITLFKKGVIDIYCVGIFASAFAIILFSSVSPVFVVIGAAISGIAIKKLQGGKA